MTNYLESFDGFDKAEKAVLAGAAFGADKVDGLLPAERDDVIRDIRLLYWQMQKKGLEIRSSFAWAKQAAFHLALKKVNKIRNIPLIPLLEEFDETDIGGCAVASEDLSPVESLEALERLVVGQRVAEATIKALLEALGEKQFEVVISHYLPWYCGAGAPTGVGAKPGSVRKLWERLPEKLSGPLQKRLEADPMLRDYFAPFFNDPGSLLEFIRRLLGQRRKRQR